MREFDKSAADAISLLDPKSTAKKLDRHRTSRSTGRAKRKLKIYKSPNTGEVVETRGGNQETLKARKEEFGSDTVESRLVRTED